jgi:dimethylhistidine N-methyltransferase
MGQVTPRLELVALPAKRGGPDLARDAREGLFAKRKHLPAAHFYDESGSRLFEEITRLPEYYLSRTELSILKAHAQDIARASAAHTALVELGSGSSQKTRALIEALLARQGAVHYVAIDISRTALVDAAKALLHDYPNLTVTALAGDYDAGLDWLKENAQGPKLVLYLGSSLGNFQPARAKSLLSSVARTLARGDGLILGADLQKDVRVVEAAYNDAAGVTAKFNLNLLRRLNYQLGAQFAPEDFLHRAFYNRRAHKIEMHLQSLRAHSVPIAALGRAVAFTRGETIHTEDSHKYTLPQLDALAASAGLHRRAAWLDPLRWFSVTRFEP